MVPPLPPPVVNVIDPPHCDPPPLTFEVALGVLFIVTDVEFDAEPQHPALLLDLAYHVPVELTDFDEPLPFDVDVPEELVCQ